MGPKESRSRCSNRPAIIARDIIEDLAVVASSLLGTVRQGHEPDFTDLDIEILKLKRCLREAWREAN